MRVEFHPEAESEVEEAQSWYKERSVVAAAGFQHELSVAIQHILDAPTRYSRGENGTRRILLKRFPFTVYYRIMEEQIVIVAIAHQKRRPGYWKSR